MLVKILNEYLQNVCVCVRACMITFKLSYIYSSYAIYRPHNIKKQAKMDALPHTHTHMHALTHACTQARTQLGMRTHTNKHNTHKQTQHTQTHTYTHIHTCTHTHARTHTHTHNIIHTQYIHIKSTHTTPRHT